MFVLLLVFSVINLTPSFFFCLSLSYRFLFGDLHFLSLSLLSFSVLFTCLAEDIEAAEAVVSI